VERELLASFTSGGSPHAGSQAADCLCISAEHLGALEIELTDSSRRAGLPARDEVLLRTGSARTSLWVKKHGRGCSTARP